MRIAPYVDGYERYLDAEMAMRKLRATALVAGMLLNSPVLAEYFDLETFEGGAEQRWEFITDGVMGGVSEGSAVVAKIDGAPGIRLTGTVSTRNNGGFLQARRTLPDGLPDDTEGLTLDVRGNGQTYYVFLRTKEMTRPWYYYNADFEAKPSWQTVRLPLNAFKRSHAHLAEEISPAEIISIGLFAYGQDFDADLMVRKISLY